MILQCNETTDRGAVIKAIRHIMLDEGIKNSDLIPKLKMTRQTVSNLLNPDYHSDATVQLDTLIKIIDAIGYKLELHIVPNDTKDEM